jgi:maleylacetate reductase
MAKTEIAWPALERITFGVAAADAVAAVAERQDARRVFLLVSRHLDEHTDEIERIRRALGARYAGSHSGIRPHVPKSDVLVAAARARDCKADLVVTVGGGSVTDTGKVLLLCLEHGIDSIAALDTFKASFRADGSTLPATYRGPAVPLVCVPTTLSGGEFNSLAGVTDEATSRKHGFEHRRLTPIAIVLDPAITRHTPQWLWTSTGVRAVDHAVETLASNLSNDFLDGFADSALRLLAEGLPRAHADPADFEARLKCQVGAAQSMIPMVCGVPMGASHAIGHLLGAVADVPHGYTSCVMAPYVQAWNAEVPNPRLARISACLGAPSRPAGDLLDALIRGLGMPRTLGEVGVRPEQYRSIAEGTMNDIWGRTNARPIHGPDDVLVLLERAARGYRPVAGSREA